MSVRPWHKPEPVEVLPPRLSLGQNLALAGALVLLIIGIRVSRLFN